jgi:Skp family chaperone for outer membrane proteins
MMHSKLDRIDSSPFNSIPCLACQLTFQPYRHQHTQQPVLTNFFHDADRAAKKLACITSWESAKKAEMEAELRKIEEQLEKKKAEYEEKLKNKLAMLHKSAEEKRALTEAKRGEEIILAEEMGAKYRAKGEAPTKLFGLLKA